MEKGMEPIVQWKMKRHWSLLDESNGDARSALNAIELGILTTERSADGLIHITLDVASECIQKRVIQV